jgi:hypothetical protein
MPAGPEQAAQLARAAYELYVEAEYNLLLIVARRLARGIDRTGWAEAKLKEVYQLRLQVERRMGIVTRRGATLVEEALGQAYARGGASAAADLDASSPLPIATSQPALRALLLETTAALAATQRYVLRSVLDAYHAAIAQPAGRVLIGDVTRRQASQQALDRLLGQGITGFVDRSGRRWDLASYTEMAVRTGVGHAAVQGHLDTLQAAGHDLVIVSNAPGECRRCRPWESKVLSISGQTRGHPMVAEARRAGLFHPGCRHRLGVYLPGVTEPEADTADPEGEAARQQQRYLERGVRQWKRRQALALDAQASRTASIKVRAWQAALRQHVAATGGKRLRYRERVGAAR